MGFTPSKNQSAFARKQFNHSCWDHRLDIYTNCSYYNRPESTESKHRFYIVHTYIASVIFHIHATFGGYLVSYLERKTD